MPPRQALKCFNCGTDGHGVRECPDISCHYCHDRGHIVDNCPKKRHRSPTGSDAGSENGGVIRPFNGMPPLIPSNQHHYGGGYYNNNGYGNINSNVNNAGQWMGGNNLIGNIMPRNVSEGAFSYNGSDKCFTCKAYGHRSEACAQTVCHECGRRGHIAKSCPQKPAARDEKKCYFCKRKGHQIADCELKRQYPLEEKLCYMCLKPGHHANECTNAAVCHMCSRSGHISNDCPSRECANCHAHGHSVARCPTVRCFRCNENGHMANECDDEADAPGGVSESPTAVVVGGMPAGAHNTNINNSLAISDQQPQEPQKHAISMTPVLGTSSPSVVVGVAGTLSSPPPTSHQPQQVVVLPTLPPLDASLSSKASGNARVCVLIDGPYFEASVRQQDGLIPDYARIRVALQHTLQFIGNIFDKQPYGFWYDMDPSSMSEFVEQEFQQPQREVATRRLQSKQLDLLSHMCSGKGLSNVVARLVGKIRHRPVISSLGFGSSWMPAGVDVAMATSIIESFESRQFTQVVLLSGDGALCSAVDFCNMKRQSGGFGSVEGAKAPVRVCGSMSTMDSLFGSRQELVDFLPRIFLDNAEHSEEGKTVGFGVHGAFQ